VLLPVEQEICENGLDFADHDVCAICGEDAAGKNEAAVSDHGYSFPLSYINILLRQ
jgi:hypothetical protein